MITIIIKRHCRVSKEGWEHGRSMTYFFKIGKIDKYELIRLVTDLLLSLYKEGWEPMTPIDTAVDKADKQTSICWRRREDCLMSRGSIGSLSSVVTRASLNTSSNECLCVETFSNNCLGFHNTPNTLLHDMVTQLQVRTSTLTAFNTQNKFLSLGKPSKKKNCIFSELFQISSAPPTP